LQSPPKPPQPCNLPATLSLFPANPEHLPTQITAMLSIFPPPGLRVARTPLLPPLTQVFGLRDRSLDSPVKVSPNIFSLDQPTPFPPPSRPSSPRAQAPLVYVNRVQALITCFFPVTVSPYFVAGRARLLPNSPPPTPPWGELRAHVFVSLSCWFRAVGAVPWIRFRTVFPSPGDFFFGWPGRSSPPRFPPLGPFFAFRSVPPPPYYGPPFSHNPGALPVRWRPSFLCSFFFSLFLLFSLTHKLISNLVPIVSCPEFSTFCASKSYRNLNDPGFSFLATQCALKRVRLAGFPHLFFSSPILPGGGQCLSPTVL